VFGYRDQVSVLHAVLHYERLGYMRWGEDLLSIRPDVALHLQAPASLQLK